MLDKPQIVQTVEQPTAIIRFTIPRNEIQNVMGPGHQELMAAIAIQGIAPTGPWFTHHLSIDPEIFDFELGVSVSAPISAIGRVQAGQLPAATVARTVYHGTYEGLGAAWSKFDAWITAEGHMPAPNLWECYVAGPESNPDPATWRTQLNRPYNQLEARIRLRESLLASAKWGEQLSAALPCALVEWGTEFGETIVKCACWRCNIICLIVTS